MGAVSAAPRQPPHLLHVAWLALAVFALAQRPAVVNAHDDGPDRAGRSEAVLGLVVVASEQVKRTTADAPRALGWVAPAATAQLHQAPDAVLVAAARALACWGTQGPARLRAHPPQGPPAAS